MTRPGLLVSVRSAAEARAAVAGGADLIDVKEPFRGPLGRADDQTIRAVIDVVGGERPVSAAFGEWRDFESSPLPAGLAFAKWGLSGSTLDDVAGVRQAFRSPVLVAYADRVGPDLEELAEAAIRLSFPVFLIDSAVKDGTTLLDLVRPATLRRLTYAVRRAGLRIALAGSLGPEEIRILLPDPPDWFAVRGAACVGGRGGTVCPDRVRELKTLIAPAD
jgi:(5-formylfuran-3-yl)methyl phosphate synthase